MDLKDVTTLIEENLNTETKGSVWNCKVIKVTEKKEFVTRVLVQFYKNDFSFEREYKLVEEHFKTIKKFENEIERLLDRLDRYTNVISDFQVLIKKAFPNITNKWKGILSEVEVESEIQAKISFKFFSNFGEFTKSFVIDFDGFRNKQFYLD